MFIYDVTHFTSLNEQKGISPYNIDTVARSFSAESFNDALFLHLVLADNVVILNYLCFVSVTLTTYAHLLKFISMGNHLVSHHIELYLDVVKYISRF